MSNENKSPVKSKITKEIKYVLVAAAMVLAVAVCAAGFYCLRGALLFGEAVVTIWQCATAPDPDVPTIRSAEFPITVTYELDSEVRTVHETLVCEYTGYVWEYSDYSNHRGWSYHLAGGKYIILLQGSETFAHVLSVECSAALMMGDSEEAPADGGEPSYIAGSISTDNGRFHPYDEEEMYRNIGNFNVAPPIENTFVPPETVSSETMN